jgi:hypothetical protein
MSRVDSSSLEVVPGQVTFRNCLPGEVYEADLEVRSRGRRPVRITVGPVSHPSFQIIYEKKARVAPGLSIPVRVRYRPSTEEQAFAEFEVAAEEGGRVAVSLAGRPPEPLIVCDTPALNFGFCKLSEPNTQQLTFRNEGERDGKIDLTSKGDKFKAKI